MTKDNQKQFWAQKSGKSPSSENIAFCASRDVRSVPMLDDILIPYDPMDELRPLSNAMQAKNFTKSRME